MGKKSTLKRLFESLPSVRESFEEMNHERILHLAQRYHIYHSSFPQTDEQLKKQIIQKLLHPSAHDVHAMLGYAHSMILKECLAQKIGELTTAEMDEGLAQAMYELADIGLAKKQARGPLDTAFVCYREAVCLAVDIDDREKDALEFADHLFGLVHGYLMIHGPTQADVMVQIVENLMHEMGMEQELADGAEMSVISALIWRRGMRAVIPSLNGSRWLRPVPLQTEATDCSFARSASWRRILPVNMPLELATTRELLGISMNQVLYGAILEILHPGIAPWKTFFEEADGSSYLTAISCQLPLFGTHRFLHLLEDMVAAGLDTSSLRCAFEDTPVMKCLEDTQKKQVRDILDRLEDVLPRWIYAGWSRQDMRLGRMLVEKTDRERERAQMPVQLRYRRLCPCGSGRIYGKCHGSVQ
ncbi:MAG: SEC-C domain-containing protein [Clostridia bacterium]|nr:SEC-C domain-containing protein [Clostridia bacterium]